MVNADEKQLCWNVGWYNTSIFKTTATEMIGWGALQQQKDLFEISFNRAPVEDIYKSWIGKEYTLK